MVLLDRVVVHFGVALVTHSVELFVVDRQLTRVLGTHLANSLGATLAVANGVTSQRGAGEWCLTELAELLIG